MAGLRQDEASLNQRGYAPSRLPENGIRQGQSTIEIKDGMQPGIYDYIAWINPGEPGCVYLKAFDTRNETRLSPRDLKQDSWEWVGWSAHSDDLFFANSQVMITEGDWDHAYPARFELWFVPDSGEPERKLIEASRQIHGWQR